MSPMQNSSTAKSKSKVTRRGKGKRKRFLGEPNDQVADTPSEFSFAKAKIAVAQICQSVGYKRSEYDALETLTDVSVRYIQAIARSAASFANASNRTNSNLFDLINGIHDLCSVKGFPGGSAMHKSNLLGSKALKEIMNSVNLSKAAPSTKPIPLKNTSGSQNPKLTIDSGTSICRFEKAKIQYLHIPSWLPDFPKENLYNSRDQVLVKERKCGEKLWEHSLAAEDCSGTVEENICVLQANGITEKEEKGTRMELAKGRGRERVKFKLGRGEEKQIGLGMNMMNGVCKGGKRVSWKNDSMVVENEDERWAFKRKVKVA